MTIEFFTGFDGCTVYNDILTLGFSVYTTNGTSSLSANSGFNDGKCLRLRSHRLPFESFAIRVFKNVNAAKIKVLAFHVRRPNKNEFSTNISYGNSVCFFQTSTGAILSLFNTATGLKFYRDSTYLGGVSYQLSQTAYHFVEVKVFSDSTVGYVKVQVDGTLRLDLTNVNTNGSDIIRISLNCFGQESVNTDFDNICIADDFQGELFSVILKPTVDYVTNFIPSSGLDNYALLQSNDGDSSYVYADGVNDKDLYDSEDLEEGYIPLCVIHQVLARKEGTGERQLSLLFEYDGIEYASDPFTLTTNYPDSSTNPLQSKTWEKAPDGTDWSIIKVNNMLKAGFVISETISS